MRRSLVQSFAAAGAVMLLVVLVGLAVEPLRDIMLGLTRLGAVSAVGVGFLAAATPAYRSRLLAWSLALAASSVASSVVLSTVSLPLVSRSDSALAAATVVGSAAAVILTARSRRWSGWFAAAAFSVAAAISLTSLFGSEAGMVGVTLWALAFVTQGALLAVAVGSMTRKSELPLSRIFAVMAGALFFQLAAVFNQAAALELADAGPAAVSATWNVGVAALTWTVVFSAVAVLARTKRARKIVPVATAVAVTALLVSAAPAGAVPPPPVDQGVLQLRSVDEHRSALSSGMTAEVGAGPRSEFRGMSFAECDRLNSRDCFITIYDDIALKQGIAAAVADIVEKVENNKGFSFPAHCHQVVHNLGQLAWYLAKDFQDIAEIDPQVCGTGYTHGIWEQFFELVPDEELFSGTATMCEDLNMSTPWYAYTCNHILGHILSTRVMDNPGLAMEACVDIKAQQGLIDCLAGGWMNFFQDDGVIAQLQQRGSVEEAFAVCRGASYETKFICYQEIFPIVFLMSDRSPYIAAQACLELSEESPLEEEDYKPWEWDVSYKDRCIQGLARAVAVSSQYDYRVALPRCLEMPEEAWGPCLSSVAASLVLNTGSVTAAFELCREIPDADYRDYCYFWSKHSWRLLSNGPNSWNMPDPGEVRLPESKLPLPSLTPAPEAPSTEATPPPAQNPTAQ